MEINVITHSKLKINMDRSLFNVLTWNVATVNLFSFVSLIYPTSRTHLVLVSGL